MLRLSKMHRPQDAASDLDKKHTVLNDCDDGV